MFGFCLGLRGWFLLGQKPFRIDGASGVRDIDLMVRESGVGVRDFDVMVRESRSGMRDFGVGVRDFDVRVRELRCWCASRR